MALNTRQLLFVEHYLKLNNATQAAIAAGYSQRTAGQIGHELLKKPEIASRVSAHTASALEAAKMEADEVLTRLTDIGRGDMRVLLRKLGVDWADDTDAPTHLIKKIKIKSRTVRGETETETELELHDPQTALNMLGKNLRLFDRAAEVDWREELRKAGISDGDLFEAAVQQYASRIEAE
jgi:phage terminase small subunit